MATYDAVTTVKQMESEMLTTLREKFQYYQEAILRGLNVELEVRGTSDVIEYTIPNTTIQITFSPENDGYGVKLFDGKDYAFVSPAELGIEDGESSPLEEGMLSLKESEIRTILELLKTASECLADYIHKKKEEYQGKVELINKY